MGLGLLLAPEVIWNPLSDEEKENLTTWLLQINDHDYSKNNWQFFRVLINIGLRKVEARYSEEAIDNSIAIIESCYLGDGWYTDGKTKQRDYYIAFAIHFYFLIYAKEMKEVDPERSQLFIDRATLFAQDNMLTFVKDNMHFVRRECEEAKVREESIYSKWTPLEGVTVETIIKPYKEGHLRTHTIHSDFDIQAVESGFSIPEDKYLVDTKDCEAGVAKIHTERGYSAVELLKGEGQGDAVICEANVNLVHPRVALPVIKLEIKKGITVIESYIVGLKNK